MTPQLTPIDPHWVRDQVSQYKAVRDRYTDLAAVLHEILIKVAGKYAPCAIVESRAKTVASFAEKIQRKRAEYTDPTREIRDLAGARVMALTREDVNKVCDYLVEHFEIDYEFSIDKRKALKSTEFGYSSVHYIVQLKKDHLKNYGIDISDAAFPDDECPMKAEIQVRTMLEHAWAVFSHDRTYKATFEIPKKWDRDLAGLAAILENVDSDFMRIHEGLRGYAASYGSYMTGDDIRHEIELLETVLEVDTGNVDLAHRIGKLSITIGDWDKAISVLAKFSETGTQPVLRDLGVAMCKKFRKVDNEPAKPQFLEGQKLLEKAIDLNPGDADAIASLAGTWKGIDEKEVRRHYKQAFEADPSDTYALGNHLEYEIAHRGDASLAAMMRPLIDAAIRKCSEQAEVGMNLPWAYYDMGKFHLLLGRPFESLKAYAKAVQQSPAGWMIGTSLPSVERLSFSTRDRPEMDKAYEKAIRELGSAPWMLEESIETLNSLKSAEDDLPGIEWVRRFLVVAHAQMDRDSDSHIEIMDLASPSARNIKGPVIIIAGGTNDDVDGRMEKYRELLLEAFLDYKGTVICGGTTDGVSGLVGEVQEQSPELIRTIGYLPKTLPEGGSRDERYKEFVETDGRDYSPLEALQYWIDLLAAGIHPSDVKVLGIDGGEISGIEYRFALALGASVAVVEESGREAALLLKDPLWNTAENFISLLSDAMTASAFVGPGAQKLGPDVRERVAEAIHEAYLTDKVQRREAEDPSMSEWSELLENLKESNRRAADHVLEKLRRIGCSIRQPKQRKTQLVKFTNEEIEIMAEMEHARWAVERILDGWRWGEEKDFDRKTSPHLVGWSKLDEEIKDLDRNQVRGIPEFLEEVGLEVVRDE